MIIKKIPEINKVVEFVSENRGIRISALQRTLAISSIFPLVLWVRKLRPMEGNCLAPNHEVSEQQGGE